ncbi:MAG: YafY family transcriptional regulator [Parafilimonas terrae]|nr:YafY family transcriptional regulator [Parafilimonas terrae]
MRRADRLFQIIQILRRSSRPITAAEISGELEVSVRTVYRDMADLVGQRVPIQGEAGLGYVLGGAFDMPPLMLTPDEIEAAVLGAQWVAGRGDPVLARAALDLIAKITAVVPERLRPLLIDPAIGTPPCPTQTADGIDVAQVRQAIREARKIRLGYCDVRGDRSERTVWPVIVGYFDQARILAAWCELRQEFRHFRTDRIVDARFLEERHGVRPALLRARWKRSLTGARMPAVTQQPEAVPVG